MSEAGGSKRGAKSAKNEADDEDEWSEKDPRYDYILQYLIQTNNLKIDLWIKMKAEPKYRAVLEHYMKEPRANFLIIELNPAGVLIPHPMIQTNYKTKFCYFIKNRPVEITDENFQDVIVPGELAPKSFDELAQIVEREIVPILTTPLPGRQWPEFIVGDMTREVYDLKAKICEARGKLSGDTLLPMPQGVELVFGDPPPSYLKRNIEEIVSKWNRSISDAIAADSSEALDNEEEPPLPQVEIQFWRKRLKNIENVYDQLRDPRVKKMAQILERFKSAYLPSLQNIFKEVVASLVEARDICLYLLPLEKYFQEIASESDFPSVKPRIKPMMHCICLTWSNSKYYCKSIRIVTLLKEISNLMVVQAASYVDPVSLFQGEAEDNLPKLDGTIDTIEYFLEIFEAFRAKIPSYFKNREPVKWSFRDKLVFGRLMKVLDRVKEIKNILEFSLEYFKLEKIEIAGLQGKKLGAMLDVIYDEFSKRYNDFSNVNYEMLLPEDPTFESDLKLFLEKVEEYDRRLGTIFERYANECYTIESLYKFVVNIGTITSRPIIFKQLWPYYEKIMSLLHKELDLVKVIFDRNMKLREATGFMEVDPGVPPIAGSLNFLRKLKIRVDQPMTWVSSIEHPLMESNSMDLAKLKHQQMTDLLTTAETQIFEEWALKVPEIVEKGLSKTLFANIVSGFEAQQSELTPNLDDDLAEVLKESRYIIIILGKTDLPPEALDVHTRSAFFFVNYFKIVEISRWYNHLIAVTDPVEKYLIEEELSAINELIQLGQETYTWNSEEVTDYVSKLYDMVKSLHDRINKAQANLAEVVKHMNVWAEVPILVRRDVKQGGLLPVGERKDTFEKRYQTISHDVEELQKVIADNYDLYFDLVPEAEPEEENDSVMPSFIDIPNELEEEEDEGVVEPEKQPSLTASEVAKMEEEAILEAEREVDRQERWKSYLAHIDKVVSDILIKAACSSISYVLHETDDTKDIEPLLEIQLMLELNYVTFKPPLTMDESQNFYCTYEDLMLDIMRMATLITRIDPVKAIDREYYTMDLAENEEIVLMLEQTSSRVKKVSRDALEYSEKFDAYSWLWTSDRIEYLVNFLRFGRILTNEEKALLANADPNEPFKGIPEKKPSLDDFQSELDRFIELYNEVDSFEDTNVFDKWLRVNTRPIKFGILQTINDWSSVIKNHLINYLRDSLRELNDFFTMCKGRFTKPVEPEDYDGLLEAIDYLKQVRDRTYEIDDAFEPLNLIVKLLIKYEVEIDEEIRDQLLFLPEFWSQVQKLAVQIKQVCQPLLNIQIEWLKKKLVYFEYRQKKLLEKFREDKVFSPECKNMYERLDNFNAKVLDLTNDWIEISRTAEIFEYHVTEFKELDQVRLEMRMLKNLWDYVNVIESNISEWKMTIWKKLDIEAMDVECKKYTRELRLLDKEVKGWELYTTVLDDLKNMMSSLRSVSELQNPAIRERHWQQLMAETQVKFTMTDKTTLEDLLKLDLHKYEEEVKSIVDKAVKEMAMENMLKELNKTWAELSFEKESHDRTKLSVLRISEEIIDTLEENQVQLQNMLGSRYIGYFLKEVSEWQQKLSNADGVINIWFEVQRAWMHLESIFIGSDDIKSQLPEDSKRFQQIDRDFKDTLRELTANLNIVKATNKPDLLEKLEKMEAALALCEKALADYLETKRLAYPRFYFISPADLLDILSNGNTPELVCRHLAKLYDSVANLKWKSPKYANALIAKDGEHMATYGVCDCTGKVEVWLNRVTEVMHRSVRFHFSRAVVSYAEKAREEWIFDYEAQPALVVSQIWWTSEVNMALAKLEEGFETALKDYQKKQISQLNALISLLIGNLTEGDRQKIMTICTIDVHARDVVAKLIHLKAESAADFQWQSQLRHRWDEKHGDCFANICDASFVYSYEYLGCTPRLVITPLTDRCYITLTQSLHLILGGAPAGPAGTGKTETTKDLGRALGQMVYVFNCSEQMDYKSCGNIYKGLAQTGAWGCFDEFNRISVEVLSVVAVQVKYVLDGIRLRHKTFQFFDLELNLVPSVGMFITMNPGYAGRTELPENLKVLFRPCAMVVPDFELICEIMLVAEGFQEARLLARKFITLYTLCKELLSKQDHYDWGLRAIKSVLVVAGKLKRDDRERPEDQVLMRALRDFNTPKIVTDDFPVFMGLIGDLFPALNVPRKRDYEFEDSVKKAALDLKLQPEEGFILKIVQLEELLFVRHSVFIIGFAGTGKTKVWRTLFRTYQNQKRKPYYNDLDPKAVSNDELFGIINPATREWKDGLVSVLMRDQANMSGDGPKWVIFDGDIDPMWIESLNTVMDDNKVLTLASNERIALTKHMRLLFEISNLRTATPATVSRAGILYINPQDLGWNPYVQSWIDTRPSASERSNLMILFEKYIPPLLEVAKGRFKKITPIPEIAHLEMLTNLLDCFLTKEILPPDSPKEWLELYFVFCCVWAFGSALFEDQLVDWRSEFSKWWLSEFKTIKFPLGSKVFDCYIDPESKRFMPWSEMVTSFELDTDVPLQATLVPTAETVRLRFFMDLLMAKRRPVMLIGGAGSGKSVIVADKLGSLPESYNVANVPFNYYTTSEMLQRILEKPLEKKAGRNYGPPGMNTLVYFIDDMNMPAVDTYGTVQPHTIIRQHMDYGHWYDRSKFTLKDIHNVQYVSCMNPTSGSFVIDSRLQRHFAAFAVSFPEKDALRTIYRQILEQHLNNPLLKIGEEVIKMLDPVVESAIYLHEKITQEFLPTVVKFHYVFNLRDLSNIFQGLLFATANTVPVPESLQRLFAHEANRVYCDKLITYDDKENFELLLRDSLKKNIPGFDEEVVLQSPLVFCHFAEGIGDPKYMPINKWDQLEKLLQEALLNYNELVSAMNLVMFEDAMYHVCRINRILESPRGNALLVGVGGSGKQSLARLSAFISSLEVFQVQLRKGYSINDLKTDISVLYTKSGLKNIPTMYLMTDSQVAEEKFLVVINDMLASGDITDLFPDDQVDGIIQSMVNEVKQAGWLETKDNCWKFFIEKVRRMLKCVLCFSPVGATLRQRARQFPAIVNCTSINWFQDWPEEALKSVSLQFLSNLEELPEEHRVTVSNFMSFVHTSVNEVSKIYFEQERRYNYTTPKSFLEQIALYSRLIKEKNVNLKNMIERLINGLEKLESCGGQADALKEILAVQEVELKKKNDIADKILQEVTAENTKAEVEKAFVTEEEAKVAEIKEKVSMTQRKCDLDLQKAEPAVRKAEEALNTLNKNNLTELKAFASPPEAVSMVLQAVLVLFSPKGKVPKDRSWKACKAIMGSADQFLFALRNYNKENIHPNVVAAIQPYITNKEFDPELIATKSTAAAGICSWVLNVMVFHYVFEDVKPLKIALAAANADLKAAMDKLTVLRARIAELQKVLDNLAEKMDIAMSEKMKCQREADATTTAIDLANRLVNGLASEKIRWTDTVAVLKESGVLIPGDVLLITAFISYVGCFTRKFRQDLLHVKWLPYLNQIENPMPMTEGLDVLSLLADDAQIAQWNNEGLPTDRMSAENATILINSTRWPLMIDPQLQGIKWIKTKYGDDLQILRLNQKNYLDKIEFSIANGNLVILENIMESVDAVLDPVLGRVLIKKGTAIKIGDKEIDYDPKFRLILHTKLANPHYKPEMQAQTTLINFTVTQDGLEEQLLGEVVKAERPDLESTKSELTKQQNIFKITLKTCEDDLLQRLANAGPDVLSDVALVENLETTKRTAAEIEIQVVESKETAIKIDEAREWYRPAATRASLLYFILNDLNKINMLYQFSLKAFSVVFQNAIRVAVPEEKLSKRVNNLIDSITYMVFVYTSRGLFETDKLTFLCTMSIQILLQSKEAHRSEVDFLLRYPYDSSIRSPVDFLNDSSWAGVKLLSQMDAFDNLDKDIEGQAKRWKKFIDSEKPEREKFPSEWKSKTPFQRLCMMRAFRIDRMTYAIKAFVEEKYGTKYVTARSIPFHKSFEETSSITPVFFILSPGVDPLKDVEALGEKMGFTMAEHKFHNVSLGQGQEPVAEAAMDMAAELGHWVILQNVHLVRKWLSQLEKKLEQLSEDPHDDYRLFVSAEPSPDPHESVIPQGILESAIKITNEPPTSIFANLHKALDNFSQETLELCSKEAEFKGILFALCYFHSVIAERRRFGPQGWNRTYPFNFGDLTISVSVLLNYLESNNRVPWEDLRYLFGEIMYGGHITDDWDRRLCQTYLLEYVRPEVIDGELFFAPGFAAPSPLDYTGYHQYVDDYLPPENPTLYGLHPNAEIGFLTATAENLFRTVLEMQPRDAADDEGVGQTREEKLRMVIEDILDKVPDRFNMAEMMAKVEDRTPYVIVALQECERMNNLCDEISRSLTELELGLKGELTINAEMEELENYLDLDIVPPSWTRRAYPSSLGLQLWYADLLNRYSELSNWTTDFSLPSTIWLGGFFNPQSLLTAIMQQTARRNEWPLDRMCLYCDVTKKQKKDFNAPPREGAYISGLYMEGARWDMTTGSIVDSNLKELFPQIPVVYIKAITQDKNELKNMYECPVYRTRMRGPTYVWTFNLRTKEKATKWTLAGVAIVLQI